MGLWFFLNEFVFVDVLFFTCSVNLGDESLFWEAYVIWRSSISRSNG